MKITILGAGNMGCAVAADLTLKGHEITLVKTSQAMHNRTYDYVRAHNNQITLKENGAERIANIFKITTDLTSISEAEIVIIMIQTNYHEKLIQKIAPYLRDDQILMITPGYFSTAYVLKYCSNVNLTIVEGESSPIDCRIDDEGLVKVGFKNVRNPLGVYPTSHLERAKEKLDQLDLRYVYLSSVVEAALHNPNMIVHTVGAVMSIPRIEKTNGEYCMYWEVFTPSVWKILEKLDEEKMDILEKVGCERIPYVEACKYRNSLDESIDAKAVFFEYAAMPTRAKGPTVVDSRYISEDVPEGLVMLEALGKQVNVKTPVCTALIELATAALGRDLRALGRTPERLGIENLKKILADCRHTMIY